MKNGQKPGNLTGLFKVLGDDTRLRILLLLLTQELSVGELQQILEVSQSALSSHLALLRESKLVLTRKEGQKVFYLFAETRQGDEEFNLVVEALKKAQKTSMSERDQQNLDHILWQRAESSTSFFDNKGKGLSPPGQTAETLFQGFLQLIPARQVVDMGCGSGNLALTLAKKGMDVTGIDSSVAQLGEARKKSKELSLLKNSPGAVPQGKIDFKLSPMEKSELPDSQFELAIFSQSLHHVPGPLDALREAFRILQPGGQILILDLLAHQEDWMREKFGDFWLGFSHQDLQAWLAKAGFIHISISDHFDSGAPKGIKTLITTARKP